MSRILKVVDDALAAALQANMRKQAETGIVKEAAAAPFTETARGLRALAASLRSDNDSVSYDDLGGLS